MYKGFQIQGLKKENFDDGDFSFSEYYEIGTKNFSRNEQVISRKLERYLLPYGILNGSQMQNDWFPNVDCDVFISHSHKDQELAIAFAGWLNYTFDLKAFVDSCIWDNSADLLRDIDNKYCYSKKSDTYNYKKRNLSTSYVHMMLNTALMQMIDKCECLFFLNTPNSISLDEINENTLSPWLFSELGISKLIRKHNKRLKEVRKSQQFSRIESMVESGPLKIKLPVDTNHLQNLSVDDLCKWEENLIENKHPLDILYSLR